MLAQGRVDLCCQTGPSTRPWPYLPRFLAYVGPMVVSDSVYLCWPKVGSSYVVTQVCHGPRLGLAMLSHGSVNPILALSPP